MIYRIILFFSIMSIISDIYAQKKFLAGYVIYNNGDTVKGKIGKQEDSLIYKQCIFEDNSGEVKVYTVKDIKAYRIIDNSYFVRKFTKSDTVFLKFLIQGNLSIFNLVDTLGEHYYLETDENATSEYLYKERIRIATRFKREIEVRSREIYKMDTIDIFKKYPKYYEKIRHMEFLNNRKMIRLAKQYNREVEKSNQYIIYDNINKSLNLILEPTIGFVSFSDLKDFYNIFYIQKGLSVHFGIPIISENFYFRTGVIYTRLDNFKEVVYLEDLFEKHTDFYKIPLQFEILFNNKKFSPQFAFGFNFYKPYYLSTSCMVGINYKLNNSFYFGINYDLDFIQGFGFIIPADLLSQSFSLGLKVKI